MNTWTIIIGLYLVSVVSLAIFLLVRKAKGRRAHVNNNLEKVFAVIALIFAPIVWIVGLGIFISDKRKGKGEERPKPLPKKLRGVLKKDVVLFQNRTMSIAEVNRITGKEYTLEQIYGKKYVASLTEEDRRQFDNGTGRLDVDDHVRKDDPDYPAIERFARARMEGRMESVRDLFDPEVTLVIYEKETLHGVDPVLGFWQERYDSSLSRRVKFDFRIVPCMFYNGTAVEESPERFASMLITFRFRSGKIIGMGLYPEILNSEYPYYGGFREAPYTEEYFSRYFTSNLEPVADRVACPACGVLSEDLEWHTFDDSNINRFYGYRGVVSVCPHCHRTVELKPEEQYDNSEVECEMKFLDGDNKRQKEPSSKVPSIVTHLLQYGKPLMGSDFVKDLDDTVKISLKWSLDGPEGEPRTAKRCAEEFHPLLIRQISREDPETFDRIVDCYRKAFLLGDVEAGNNLGILYYNYGDREDEGLATLKACAGRGNANAIANCFFIMWDENPAEAVDFALSFPALPSPVCWNLAVLHLRGDAVEGNPLPADREKAKQYLRMVVDGTTLPVGDAEDTANWLKKAEALLPAVDDYDELVETARDYVDIAIPRCIRCAENPRFRSGLEHDLHRALRHFSIPEGLSLRLGLASEEHNDHGDISRFFLVDKDMRIVCQEEDILYRLDVERSAYGAWDAYLFSKAVHLLPTWWHGGYNRETLIFSPEDLDAVRSLKGHALDVVTGGDDLRPRVSFNGDIAVVESCTWSEWGGLFREVVTITFDGNRIKSFERTGNRNIYDYDCGIMF